jgi:sterol desaturase/sphingolipid hydroxylase (fatty acid hydroxylase superfamily)
MDIFISGPPRLSSLAVDVARLFAWLLLLAVIFVPLERLFAVHPRSFLRKGIRTDLGYYFLSGLLTNVALVLPMAVIAAGLHRIVPVAVRTAAADLPLWAHLLAALAVGEVGFYWGHRWSHTIPWLWRFHAVHHSAQEIDWLVNTRAHPVDMVFTRLCGFVLLYVCGLASTTASAHGLTPVFVLVIGAMWGFFVHANVKWRFGWLEWVVATPAFHHWHHTNDQHRDRNYAAMLPCLDRLFGTFHLPRHAMPPSYGIDAPVPSGLGRQLLWPLMPINRSVVEPSPLSPATVS